MKGGSKVVTGKHRHKGVFITWGKEDALCTKNLVPGEAVYNEKRVSVQAPGSRVLYLGAASGTTVSHVSDLVGRGLVNMAKKRTNVIPIIEDARHPAKYRMLVGMVDVIFSDVAQPDQARILALNASYFLKTGGHFVISIKANCIDSTEPVSAVFAQEVKKLQADHFNPIEQVTLQPFERDHACVIGAYHVASKHKVAAATS
ncbi:hypothetical protein RHSIM_Rhsim09G0199600 [Rhododendron simsii]|uniref:Fibrillarin n=1 Tax=Rhododendron simsii TaxID=118357 RepID=A0A834GEL8_RHOSS|nr:hypothetical protein RHSIM_Rhsim09G0199600 [Rhododendron simsii]